VDLPEATSSDCVINSGHNAASPGAEARVRKLEAEISDLQAALAALTLAKQEAQVLPPAQAASVTVDMSGASENTPRLG
jgi:hypothetical protein